jgi:hypothetical protein
MSALAGDIVRSAEWRRVRDFALGVRARPAVLAIEGEAGAGKSTLWRAGVEAAVGAGHRLLRSEPSAGEADLSFAGLSDLLVGVLPAVAADIPGPQLEALEVALLLRAPGGEPPTARAMGLGVLAALRGCASRGPVLVAIDDSSSRSAVAVMRTRCVNSGLNLAADSSRPVVGVVAGRIRPRSMRVVVLGWTIANCLRRRRLR